VRLKDGAQLTRAQTVALLLPVSGSTVVVEDASAVRSKSTALPAVARLGVMRARRVMRIDSDPGPPAACGGGSKRRAARAPHRGPLRGLGGHVLFEAVAVDAGRSSVARRRRRSAGRPLVAVVGVGAEASLCPEEGQEHKHGQQAKRPPGDDPGVPGGRPHP
jgi:hypothetical protein